MDLFLETMEQLDHLPESEIGGFGHLEQQVHEVQDLTQKFQMEIMVKVEHSTKIFGYDKLDFESSWKILW